MQFTAFTMIAAFIIGVVLMLSFFNLILFVHLRSQMHNMAAAYHESIRQILHHISNIFQLGPEAGKDLFLCPKCANIVTNPAQAHDRYCPRCKERFPEAG